MAISRALTDARALLTFNYDDFKDLHLLIRAAAGRHPGLLVIRKDNDSSRDLSISGIVTAIRKLEGSAPPIENEYHILNYYR